MVAGADDDEPGDEGVRPAGDPHPAVRGVPLQHHRHPQRPAGVQGREGRELVGQAAQALGGRGVAAPPPVTGRQRQHVGVPAEEPRRSGRQQEVGDQRDDRADEQRATGGDVGVGAATVEPDEDDGGHHVVRGGVPEAAEQAQPAGDREDLVERGLPREVQGALDVEELGGAALGRAQRVAREEAGARVGDVEGEDDEHLHEGRAPAPGGSLRPGSLPDLALRVPRAPHVQSLPRSLNFCTSVVTPDPPLRRPRHRRGYRRFRQVWQRAPTLHEYQTARRGNVHRCGPHSASGHGILHRIRTTDRAASGGRAG